MNAIPGIRMKNPAHPGGFVKSEIIEALELSITDAAKALRVTRQIEEAAPGSSTIDPKNRHW
jgi:plasmid maintenance system antidote protein VapI